MKEILTFLDEREQEFDRHLSVARMLEARVDETARDGDIHVEVRHINTLKSGLLVHLYNIVEAISTRTLENVGQVVASEKPGQWTESVLKEWVRAAVWGSDEKIGEAALNNLTKISSSLAAGGNLDAFVVKGVPGSWDDSAISKIAQRLGCDLILSEPVKRAAYETKYRNDTSALRYLALRRNDIAHGNTTFEEGAYDLTLNDIDELATRVLPFLEEVTKSYDKFLENKDFLKINEEAA